MIGLSSFGTKPIEQVVPANESTFYQLYWTGTRDDVAHRVERARRAGAKALIVTLDATGGGLGPRDWGASSIPARPDLAALFKFAPLGTSRPAWLARFLWRSEDALRTVDVGADVAKALALGRAWLWGLAAGGEDGVNQVLEIMRTGLERALVGLGHSSIGDLSLDDLEIPEGFLLEA